MARDAASRRATQAELSSTRARLPSKTETGAAALGLRFAKDLKFTGAAPSIRRRDLPTRERFGPCVPGHEACLRRATTSITRTTQSLSNSPESGWELTGDISGSPAGLYPAPDSGIRFRFSRGLRSCANAPDLDRRAGHPS